MSHQEYEAREWLSLARDMQEVAARLDRSMAILCDVAETMLYSGAAVRQRGYELKAEGRFEAAQEKKDHAVA